MTVSQPSFSAPMDAEQSTHTPAPKTSASNACLPCRNVKMKCVSPRNHVSPEVTADTTVYDDLTNCRLLSFPVALGFFNSFMRSLNPFISQFDPQLQTFQYVQQKSPFLLTSILAATARAFHSSLHGQLRAHTEQLLAKCFMQGTKSTEVIQGVLVTTYWKEPDDTKSWLFVGYVIRMAIELGWHKLKVETEDEFHNLNEEAIREARNIRRTWLILFVYDRRSTTPCMIEPNEFILKSQDWYRQSHAVFGADTLLFALISLRILSSEIVELVSPDAGRHVPSSDHLMRLLNANLTRWEEHWKPVMQDERVDHCQSFLIVFYGLHLRLLLNSYALQNSLKSAKKGDPISRQADWTCYATAVDMLKEISGNFGLLKLLYFAQDSVHVMTAYAAVFLIKLLLSLPTSLSKELEEPSLEAIRKVALIFEAQCASQSTGCALQARFLKSIVLQYGKAKEQPRIHTSSHPSMASQKSERTSKKPAHQHMLGGTHLPQPANLTPAVDRVTTGSDLNTNNTMDFSFDDEFSTWNFDNNGQWEAMFADAGYGVHDGIFLP